MYPGLKKRTQFTSAEFFFTQKFLELFFYSSLDSYRVRLHNPKTILEEFCQVLEDWHRGKVKNFDLTILSLKKEVQQLLDIEENLIFKKISKESFKKILNKIKDKEYLEAYYAAKTILADNTEYVNSLFTNINTEIKDLNKEPISNPKSFILLDILSGFLASELYNFGLSKRYLLHLSSSLFGRSSRYTFTESIEEFKRILINRNLINFKVYFKINVTDFKSEILKVRIPEILDSEGVEKLFASSKNFRKYINEERKKFPNLLCYEVSSLDYYDAVKIAKAKFSEIRDLLKFGYTERNLKIYKKVLLCSGNNSDKFEEYTFHYQIEGKVESSEELYEKFHVKYSAIRDNEKLARETKDKIKSAIRYFRLGTEAVEIEQRFINYWIGIEYLFSSHDAATSTFTRFKTYFSKLHTITYLKRNLIEFHRDIKRLEIETAIQGFDDDLQYLMKSETFKFIAQAFVEVEPLLAFRANQFYLVMTNDKELHKYINKHKENIEAHLIRIYRIRNEIVHEAAIKPNIENLTSNLRYYLVHTINVLIDFFFAPPNEININGLVNIDDFYIFKSLEFENYQNSKNIQRQMFDNEYTGNIVY